MTPFDINPDNDAGHALDQDDLIAFHLHELPAPQERALHRVLRTQPHLQAESLAIASTLRAFPKHEPIPTTLDATAATARIWQSLRPTLTPYIPTAPTPLSFFRLQLQRWALPTLAAVATTAFFIALHRNEPDQPATLATVHQRATISPSPASPTGTTTSFGAITHPYRAIFPPPSAQLFAPSSAALTSTPVPVPAAGPVAPAPYPAISPTTTSTESPLPLVATNSQPLPTQPSTPRPSSRTHHDHTTDLTLAVVGDLTPDRSFTSLGGTGSSAVTASYIQVTTPSVGALASFHQQLRPLVGYRVTASYSEPTFQYVYSVANSSEGNIVSQHAYELSGAYVVDGPRHRRISTSAEAGAGLLALLPANHNQSAVPVGNAYRADAVFGVSAEFALSKHFAVHTEYRALLYKTPSAYPTYGTTIPPAPGNLTLSSEPVIGITYRFHEASE